ncbi:MAG: DUF177 domain-containing protein [bacterium]
MKLNVHNLANGTHTFEFVADFSELELTNNTIFSKSLNIKSKVDKRDDNLVVTTEFWIEADFECDNCLESFSKTLRDEFTLLYTSDQDLFEADEDDSIQLLSSKTSEIDLTFGVHDALLLSAPMRVTCSPDCKGLCPGCGRNLNKKKCSCTQELPDPRWEGLKKLVS